MPEVAGIHHVSVTVTDIERSVPWYSEVLGLTKLLEETHPDGTGYAIVLGKPDDSALIKSLKGVAPFDGSNYPRMPVGGPYVNDADIAFIAQWIKDGCPDSHPAARGM